MFNRPIAALALAALLAGCPAAPVTLPDAGPTPGPTATPGAAPAEAHNSDQSEQTACRLLRGEATAVTATAEATGAPALAEGAAYALTLPGGAEGRAGTVRFEAARGEEISIYMDRDLLLIVRGPDGDALPSAKIPGSKFCGEIAVHRVYEMKAGMHTLELGPTDAESVRLVITPTHPHGAGAGAH